MSRRWWIHALRGIARLSTIGVPLAVFLIACSPPAPAGLDIIGPPPAAVSISRPAIRQHIVVLGDSTGEFLGRALATLPQYDVTIAALRRCPLLPYVHTGRIYPTEPDETFAYGDGGHLGIPTDKWPCDWLSYLWKQPIKGATVLIYAGPMMEIDFTNRGSILDRALPMIDAGMKALVGAVRLMGAAKIVLVTSPRSLAAADSSDGRFWLDQRRVDAWNGELEHLARLLGPPGPNGANLAVVSVVDYATWSATQSDPRPDGSHMEGPGAIAAARWIMGRVPQP